MQACLFSQQMEGNFLRPLLGVYYVKGWEAGKLVPDMFTDRSPHLQTSPPSMNLTAQIITQMTQHSWNILYKITDIFMFTNVKYFATFPVQQFVQICNCRSALWEMWGSSKQNLEHRAISPSMGWNQLVPKYLLTLNFTIHSRINQLKSAHVPLK